MRRGTTAGRDGGGPSRAGMTGSDPDLGALYDSCRERVVSLVTGLTPDELARRVPACPAWTVRDLLGHLTGIAEDAVAGRLSGPPGEDATSAQVAARRDLPLSTLLGRWADAAGPFADRVKRHRVWAALIDAVTHEHDLRGALARPGARDSDGVRAVVPVLLDFALPVRTVIRLEDDEVTLGPEGQTALVLETDRFDTLRWRMGRRSRRQMAAMRWSADPAAVIGHLTVFAPAADDIIE